MVSTHSRPKAAVLFEFLKILAASVSTHSRPKAAVNIKHYSSACNIVSTHSRPKAAVFALPVALFRLISFQHTAARRRLYIRLQILKAAESVSTHSRPKAAVLHGLPVSGILQRFNTQPPEGGCADCLAALRSDALFQHTAARRRLLFQLRHYLKISLVSTHSRPKAAVKAKN